MALSGRRWVSKYREIQISTSMLDLSRGTGSLGDGSSGRDMTAVPFLTSLNSYGRQYLMHYAFRIAREGLDPRKAPPLRGMEIQWLHADSEGRPDLAASVNAAEQMVQGFGLFRRPPIATAAPGGATASSAERTPASRAPVLASDSTSVQEPELSGREWVARYPGSRTIDTLELPFREGVNRFLRALAAARAVVTVANTVRPPERAYLMHYSFRIARESLDPALVPALPGVGIQWLHRDSQGRPELDASRNAAEQMVQAFRIVYRPALKSRHTEGLAIDMNITWQDELSVEGGDGSLTRLSGAPRNGAENRLLHEVGASYGVIKLAKDAPHWSSDGH